MIQCEEKAYIKIKEVLTRLNYLPGHTYKYTNSNGVEVYMLGFEYINEYSEEYREFENVLSDICDKHYTDEGYGYSLISIGEDNLIWRDSNERGDLVSDLEVIIDFDIPDGLEDISKSEFMEV
jgi:hypothetical protein